MKAARGGISEGIFALLFAVLNKNLTKDKTWKNLNSENRILLLLKNGIYVKIKSNDRLM